MRAQLAAACLGAGDYAACRQQLAAAGALAAAAQEMGLIYEVEEGLRAAWPSL